MTSGAWIVSTGMPESEAGGRRQRAAQRLEQVKKWIEGVSLADGARSPWCGVRRPGHSAAREPGHCTARGPAHSTAGWAVPGLAGLESNFEPAAFLDAVRRAVDFIHAGDCFQVNLAQRLLFPFTDDPVALYRRLRQRNPAPFAGYFDQGDFVLASASPERFLEVDRGAVCTRPIKGTRPRGGSEEEDCRRQEELLASAKDRAENIMIVDLLRNDLGRACAYGSIHVPVLCQIESFAYVHHLVSEVRGRLRHGQDALDLLRAAFPGGSITGAPKIRAMEIIAELEPHARGWYCGSLGYVGFDGSMDSNILIRSFTLGHGWAQFPVGAGIVADSDPQREYEETWHKAKGMAQALLA